MSDTEHTRRPDTLQDLSYSEFERLVADALSGAGYSEVRLASEPTDHGWDITATRDGEPIAVEVKHKRRVGSSDIRRFVGGVLGTPDAPHRLLLVTSGDVSAEARASASRLSGGFALELMDRADVLTLFDGIPQAAPALNGAQRRRKADYAQIALSALTIIFALVATGATVTSWFSAPTAAPLGARIDKVDQALANMRDLEDYLRDVRADMLATQQAAATINQDYAQAQELQKLSDAQLDAVQAALLREDWKRATLNYSVAFVLGIASSLFATGLYSVVRRKLGK